VKVLVVDDHRQVREMIGDVLEHAGYEVVKAGSAKKALSAFRAGAFDMITLDHRMPGVTGAELHEMLAQEFGERDTGTGYVAKKLPPVLIITATPADDQVLGTAFGEGVVGVLQKPFEAAELIRIVDQALGVTRD